MSALPPKSGQISRRLLDVFLERRQATRSSLELACDKFLDHLTRLVGLRTRFRDPFVNGILEQAIVALAAGGSVGLCGNEHGESEFLATFRARHLAAGMARASRGGGQVFGPVRARKFSILRAEDWKTRWP